LSFSHGKCDDAEVKGVVNFVSKDPRSEIGHVEDLVGVSALLTDSVKLVTRLRPSESWFLIGPLKSILAFTDIHFTLHCIR